MLAGLVVIHARGAGHDGVDLVTGVAALAGCNAQLTLGVAGGVVVHPVTRVAVLVGALVTLRLVADLARVGAQLRELVLDAVKLAAVRGHAEGESGEKDGGLHGERRQMLWRGRAIRRGKSFFFFFFFCSRERRYENCLLIH